jgi:hypothetical protein
MIALVSRPEVALQDLRITKGSLVSGLPQIQTVLVCSHSARASLPPSRPNPLRL